MLASNRQSRRSSRPKWLHRRRAAVRRCHRSASRRAREGRSPWAKSTVALRRRELRGLLLVGRFFRRHFFVRPQEPLREADQAMHAARGAVEFQQPLVYVELLSEDAPFVDVEANFSAG